MAERRDDEQLLSAETWHPAPEGEPAPALYWIPDGGAVPLPAARLHEAGFAVSIGAPAGSAGDREAVRSVAQGLRDLAARPEVDAERVVVAGEGRGGTLAFLAGCQSDRAAAVLNFHGSLVYDGLDASRPAQPLELALNLGAPFLGVFDENQPETSREHQEHVSEVLSQFARDFDIVVAPSDDARETWTRVLEFLERVFDEI